MKKPLIFICAGLFSCIQLSVIIAQSNFADYPLRDYKLPRLERHLLETDFRLDGNLGNNNQNEEDLNVDSYEIDRDSKTSQFNLKLSPRYSYYLNAEKL